MEAEVAGIVGAEKNAHNPSCRDYRCGYRPRRLDTRMGTMYLMVPKLRSRGYIPVTDLFSLEGDWLPAAD